MDLNILMVTPYYLPMMSGASLYVHHLVKGLIEQGIKVRVHTTNCQRASSPLDLGLNSADIDVHRHRSFLELKRSYNPISLSYVVSTMKDCDDFDIVHIHDFPKICNEALILFMKRLKRAKPLVLTPHGAGSPQPTRNLLSKIYWFSGIPLRALTEVDRIIAVSPVQAELFANVCGSDKVSIIPEAVPDHYFVDKPSFLDDGKLKVLFIGRIVEEKGINELLYAAHRALEVCGKMELVCLGPDGGYLNRAIELMNKLALNNVVKMVGTVPEAEKLEHLNWCDVLVLPSYYEAFGIPLLEAMAHGKPVIASKTVGGKSLVEDGKTGFLVDIGDWNAVAEYLIKLTREPHLKFKMGESGLQRASQFSLRKMVEKHIEIYRKLLQAKLSHPTR